MWLMPFEGYKKSLGMQLSGVYNNRSAQYAENIRMHTGAWECSWLVCMIINVCNTCKTFCILEEPGNESGSYENRSTIPVCMTDNAVCNDNSLQACM